MLLELEITNIALIESLSIEFAQGFNVLTGETGAGKSIVVDSVNLALGGRADRDIIKNGRDKGSVQAIFDISGNAAAAAFAEELGLEIPDGIVAVRRELSRNGRNICRIGGSVVPLTTLKAFTALLVDVHGQHEHQALMDSAKHMAFLDAFGGEAHAMLLKKTQEAHRDRSSVASQLKKLLKDASERDRLIDILSFQVNEISNARLKEGEEEKLKRKLTVLENSEKIRERIENAYTLTYRGEGGEMSAQEALRSASEELRGIASIDERYARLQQALENAYYTVQEIGHELQMIREEVRSDPALLDKINNRLDQISRLERKYGATEAEVIAFAAQAAERLSTLTGGEERIAELKHELKEKDKILRECCEELTHSREALAEALEKELLCQLADVGMGKTRFKAEFRRLDKPTADGAEQIEFMISANPGEPLKPMAAIASGGELSRIMLAMKAVALDHGGVDSMVFDEIDTGVSGRMAQAVGEKMCLIAIHKQVLCVTHLPQIAALGNKHFLVEKTVENGKTSTNVLPLEREGRIREISRLVGGAEDSQSSLSHAEHMLDDADTTRLALRERIS